jgi:hypothetical protein
MYVEHALASKQVPDIFSNGFTPTSPVAHGWGEVLGQEILFSVLRVGGPRRVFAAKRSRLENLKVRRFAPEGKAERVRKSLAALQQQSAIGLTPGEWRHIAEDPDLEDEY